MQDTPSKHTTHAPLCDLKNQMDGLFILAEDMESYYNEEYDIFEDNDVVEEFEQQGVLLLKQLEGLSAQGDFAMLWETSIYAIGKFLDCSNAYTDSLQEFVSGLTMFFLKAAQALGKSNDTIYGLFTAWESKGRNIGFGVFSDLLEKLPSECQEKWAVDALEKWRGYPPCTLGIDAFDEEREYLERHLLAWAEKHRNSHLKLEILEKKLCMSGDVVALSQEYRRQGMLDKAIALLQMAYQTLDRDWQVTDLLIEEMQNAGDNDLALKLAWEEFVKTPQLNSALNRLKRVAERINRWQEYHNKAQKLLEKTSLPGQPSPSIIDDY
jgi:tetratricopeptide (TPR) repeat protein